MFSIVCSLLLLLPTVTSQGCQWAQFFKDTTDAESCVIEGVSATVDCKALKPSESGTVNMKCGAGEILTGYTGYTCDQGKIYPASYQSSCVSGDTLTCTPPKSGKFSNYMRFLQDDYHKLDATLQDVEYHVECSEGFMFKDGTDVSLVKGRCTYKNRRATLVSDKECLPGCPIKDVTTLSTNIDNLDRITIIYPTNLTRVGDGAEVFARASCSGPYSSGDRPTPLYCSTVGVLSNTADGGYFIESKDCANEGSCLTCNRHCTVPDIEDGDVFDRSGTDDSSMKRLEAGSEAILSGNKTAYVKCNEGFNLVGNRYLKCSDGSIISEIPTCSGKGSCSAPIIENGVSGPDKSSTSSIEYTVSCNDGYTLGDPKENKVQCSVKGSASYSTLPVCHMGCSVPKVPNGVILNKPESFSKDMPPFKTGATVEVGCNDGYIPTTGSNKCDVTGWVELTVCVDENEQQVKNENSAAKGVGLTVSVVLAALSYLML